MNFASGLIFGDAADAAVVGTFRSAFDRLTIVCVSVARNLIRSQASSGCFEPFGIATRLPRGEARAELPGLPSPPPGTARCRVDLRLVTREERRPPLAVVHHRDASALEVVRGRELLTQAGGEAEQLAVAVPVDQRLLPLEERRPAGIPRDLRLARRVEPARAVGLHEAAGDGVLVVLAEGHEARDLDRAVGVSHGQLLGVGCELRQRPRRVRDPLRLEHGPVVVEAVGVGERRQRALVALVARERERGLREHAHVERSTS